MRINAPKGVLSEKLRVEIAERKAEILGLLLADGIIPPPISRQISKAPAPLSFAQERLWFLEQLDPLNAAYNISRAWRVTGKLNVSVLEKSVKEVVRRHAVLRSAVRVEDGKPMQVVGGGSGHRIRIKRKTTHKEEIRQRLREEAETPVDFAKGPFLRAVLLYVGSDEHVFILTLHHMMADAWSMGILTRELWTLYETFANKNSSALAELPIQYSDFAVWQRDWLQGEVLEAQLAYWKKQLADIPILNLPTDRPRPPRQSFRGARVPIELPESLTLAINDLSHDCNATPFMVLLAAFQVLIYRYSGQEDFIVGSPVSNRNRTELEPLIGFFVNTLVLRSHLSGMPSFKELVVRVREVCLGAYAHQELPYEKLVEELKPERDQSRNPLFQVMFVLQNATRPFGGITGLNIEPIEIESTRSQFDLSLFLRERDGKYIGFIEYSTDLFDRDQMERMVGHFQTLLEGIVDNPEQSIATLPTLADAEQHQVLVEWNDTAADYPNDKCIHQLFEEQSERTPEAIAVEFNGQPCAYRELNRRANQLAHYLIGLGRGPEKPVGICVERSVEMVVGLLGILKAGCAYMPLDPAYPTERLRLMIEDAGCRILLTQLSVVDDRKWKKEDGDPQFSVLNPRLEVVALDRDSSLISKESAENPLMRVGSETLAYVIYTSGSTGQPKGVEVAHRSVVNCLYAVEKEIGITDADVWCAVTTFSFDIAALEVFLPLLSGAKVVLASREQALDGVELCKCLQISGATVMQATPPTWNLLLDSGWQGSSRFKILCGGEALSRRLADRFIQIGGLVWNLYGPTETAIWSTIHRVEPSEGPVYIGRPLANTQIYILNDYMQPVPIAVHGDLYIAGDGVARGYLNRSELTAELFIRNPFTDNPRSRLYKTGDRARYRPDGNIEFLGRSDLQVKIRGHRIELGEIEAALKQHPEVRDAVIVARDCDSLEDKELVGYVVSTPESEILVSELRDFLQNKLPDYMIPSVFVLLDALPQTPNRKFDRIALPPPDGARPELYRGFVAPRSELEELVAQVWREVLKLDKVGVHDNFFELGGHSLLATQIVSKVHDALGQEVPVRLLFDAPTIAKLSAGIASPKRAGFPSLPPIAKLPRPERVPLSVNQEQLWRIDQLVPRTHFFNMPYVYRLSGELNVGALEKSVGEIVRRHESLRTVFGEAEGLLYQVIHPTRDFRLRVIDLRKLNTNKSSDQAAGLILEEKRMPFDLETGPLLRTKLVRLTARENFLLITFHHIIADFWSVQVFRSELATLYKAFSRGLTPSLPEPRMQAADYAIWERRQLDDHGFDQQLHYWRRQLAPPLNKLNLAKSRQQMKGVLFQTKRIAFELDESSLATIKATARQENVTPFVIVLSALNIALHRWTQATDIRIGVLLANRIQSGSQDVIGHFVNTVVARNHVDGQMTFRQLLKQVHAGFLAASSNLEFPFAHLVRVLTRETKIERSNLFQVLLSYQSPSFVTNEFSGITFAPLGWRPRRTTSEAMLTACDMAFNLRETETKLTGTVNVRTSVFGKRVITSKIQELAKLIPYVAENLSASVSLNRRVLK